MRVAWLLLCLAACGSDTDDRPVSWAFIHAAIVVPNCTTSGCHSALSHVKGGSGGGGDFSDSANAKDVFHGYLYDLKLLRGTATYTTQDGQSHFQYRMPPDQPLPERDIKLIEAYFKAGEPD